MNGTPIPSPQTLKLNGELKGIPIQVLVDSGASHNFISRKLVSILDLPIKPFLGLHIQLGDGHRIWVHEKCAYDNIKLREFSCRLIALVFEFGDLDTVLRIEWLKSLGEVIHNLKEWSMRFKQRECWVELKSSLAVEHLLVSLKGWFAKQKRGFVGQIGATEEQNLALN